MSDEQQRNWLTVYQRKKSDIRGDIEIDIGRDNVGTTENTDNRRATSLALCLGM